MSDTDWKPLADVKIPEEKHTSLLTFYRENAKLKQAAPVALDSKDPRGRAKLFAVTLMEFLRVGQGQYGLSAEDVLYAVELNAMNLFNMDDFPLSPEKRQQIRDSADAYYIANRALAPPPPTRKR
jgi:hypothetical protein